MPQRFTLIVTLFAAVASMAVAQTARQPKVAPGPDEPDWSVILEERYGLSMFGDLVNPVKTTPEATPGLFKKAGSGPVSFTPLIALGLPAVTRGGWYVVGGTNKPDKHNLWSYAFKNTADDLKTGNNLPPPLAEKSATTFDPKDQPFGLWISTDEFHDGGVFTEPSLVAALNARLAKQPYKAMIYPYRDKTTGQRVPHSYLIGWEYSTNDDFQDVVCRIDNVELIAARLNPQPAR
jgi:hypothetical protein